MFQLFMLGSNLLSYSECFSYLYLAAVSSVIMSASVIYAGQETTELF